VSRVGLSRPGGGRPTASDQLTQDVLDLVRSEGLRPGDRLPTVSKLATRFAVATPTMRESLRRLQAIGLLQIRQGSGVYVREPVERVLMSNPYMGQLDARVILNLIDARLLIEPHLARLAVTRCKDEDVLEIEGILRRAGAALREEDAVLGGLNMDFHLVLARLAGNVVLSQTIESLIDLYAAEQLVVMKIYDNREHDHAEHLAIFEAVRERDAELASERMRTHLEGVRAVLQRRLEADA
jgi:GntR family transcriptional regulator, transcriptional repressor for pyruvate dehydrogenase complex